MVTHTNQHQDYRTLTKQQLIADFKVVVADAEALIQATAAQGGEVLSLAREKATESLRIAKEKMAEAQVALTARGKVATAVTSEYVRRRPVEALGVAAIAGLVIGLLISRR